MLIVSRGYDFDGKRRNPQQKTGRLLEDLTPRAKEKWLEEAAFFERQCHNEPVKVDKAITLVAYTELWLREIAPTKLAKSTLARNKQDIDRFMLFLGGYKLADLKPEHFRNLYAELRKQMATVRMAGKFQMNDGSMFSVLHDYADESYCKAHLEIVLETENGAEIYQVAAVLRVAGSYAPGEWSIFDQINISVGDFNSFVENLKNGGFMIPGENLSLGTGSLLL